MRKPQLLWVDDHITGFEPYTRALADAGFQVTAVATPDDAVENARNKAFDVVLCDIWMEPIDGVELLKRIRPLQDGARLGVLSSYLYLDRFRDELRSLDFPVQLIDKDMPNVESSDFQQRFLDPVRALLSQGITHTIQDQDRHLKEVVRVDDDPFKMPLADFLRKPILEKDRLVKKARHLARATLDRAFKEGNIWVLLYCDASILRAGAKTPLDIPSEEEIMEQARKQHRAPFQFFKPLSPDDIWSDCSEDNTFNYPTVTLQFPGGELDVHFDTGAPMTFFSYEDLVQLQAMKPVTTGFGVAYRGALDYMAIPLNVEVVLRCQTGGQTRLVRLSGQAVRDWANGPFARNCNFPCKYRLENVEVQLCRGRRGLIGRNLMTENKLRIVLDGILRQTGVS
jgi:CheY-like chemotaxis protein